MTTPYTCDAFGDRLADFLERDVDETVRAAMEAHALACADCGVLLGDLRTMRINAANLPELAPNRDLWSGIAARIETPVVRLNAGAGEPRARRFMPRVWYGAAAAALVIVTATITREVTRRGTAANAPASAVTNVAAVPTLTPAVKTPSATDTTTRADTQSALGAPQSAVRGPRSTPRTTLAANHAAVQLTAQQTYDHEITRLRAIVDARRSKLDTATVRVIEHNLQVIDDAITQCKAALKKDPASRYLMESLDDALDTKVQLLRTAAMLPTRA